MTRKFKTRLPVGFPTFGDKLKAEDYWRSVNRYDLQAKIDTIVEEFRSHHEAHDSMFSSWPAAWKTWYVRATRFIQKPKSKFEPRGEGVRKRDFYRAPTDEPSTVPLSMVREFAAKLNAKAKS